MPLILRRAHSHPHPALWAWALIPFLVGALSVALPPSAESAEPIIVSHERAPNSPLEEELRRADTRARVRAQAQRQFKAVREAGEACSATPSAPSTSSPKAR